MERQKGVTRRVVLDVILGSAVAAAALSMLSAVLMYLWPGQAGARGSKRVKVGPLSKLPRGSSQKVMVQGAPVIVVNLDGDIRGFSAKCTHLGCVVDWEAGRRQFVCPCHAAIFDADGKPLVNITSVPLPRYMMKTSGDMIYVEGT